MSHIFISYSRTEKDFVDQLRADLEKSGVTVWIDTKGIRPGAFSWEEVIRDAIERASAVLLIASPDARKSPYVKGELAIAQMYNHPVYPIWAEGRSWIDCVPLNMAETQYIDAREGKYAPALSQIIEALGGSRPELALASAPVPVDVVLRNPYKGLLAFTEDDKEFFFGRENLTDTLADALDACFSTSKPKIIAVVGASGSGKSSVVMAGLLPRLDKNVWRVLRIVPGTKPLDALMYAIADVYDKSMSVIEEDLQNPNGLGLHRIARRLAKSGQRVLLFVDQSEEVFTLAENEYQRRQFLNLLTNAAIESDSVLATILTMRADYYDRPMNYPQFGELVQNSTRSVMAMSLLELLEAIEQPAAHVGLRFEAGIVTEMVNELRDRAGALPLMQFTLNQLYEKREGNLLTRAAYQQIGGVQGAIGHHADEIFNALPQETQDALPRVAAKLVNIDETATPTRRRALLSEFEGHKASQNLVEKFIKGRLLIIDRQENANFVEISHEALLTSWVKLHEEIEKNKEGLRQLRRVQLDAQEWESLGRPKYMLWAHERLKSIYEWSERLQVNFEQYVLDFILPEWDRLDEALKSETTADYEKLTIIKRLAQIGADAVPLLVEAYFYSSQTSYVLSSIIDVLNLFPIDTFDLLCEKLNSRSPKIRRWAIIMLNKLNDDRSIEKIILMLNDKHANVRATAVEMLGMHQTTAALDQLIELCKDPNVSVRRQVAWTLGKIKDTSVIIPLVRLLEDQDELVVRNVIQALGAIGDPQAIEPLINLWHSAKKASPDDIVAALIHFRDERIVPYLIEALDSTDEWIRHFVIETLGDLKDARAVPFLIKITHRESIDDAYTAIKALQKIATPEALKVVQHWLEQE